MAKTTRKKLPVAGKSSTRKALSAPARPKVNGRSSSTTRAATTAKATTKSATAVAEKPRSAKAANNHRTVELRSQARPEAAPATHPRRRRDWWQAAQE